MYITSVRLSQTRGRLCVCDVTEMRDVVSLHSLHNNCDYICTVGIYCLKALKWCLFGLTCMPVNLTRTDSDGDFMLYSCRMQTVRLVSLIDLFFKFCHHPTADKDFKCTHLQISEPNSKNVAGSTSWRCTSLSSTPCSLAFSSAAASEVRSSTEPSSLETGLGSGDGRPVAWRDLNNIRLVSSSISTDVPTPETMCYNRLNDLLTVHSGTSMPIQAGRSLRQPKTRGRNQFVYFSRSRGIIRFSGKLLKLLLPDFRF